MVLDEVGRDATVPVLPTLAPGSWRALWARTAIEGAVLVVLYFLLWDLSERTWLGPLAASHLQLLHLVRGTAAALMLGTWSFLRIRSARIRVEAGAREHLALLDERVRERTRELRQQERMASLGMLTAGFAHDLGNPLASLSTELELLEGEDDVTQLRESHLVLRKHVARMSRTLREMVDFARRRRDAVSEVSISAAVSDAVRLVNHDPRWKNVTLRVDVPADLPSLHMVEDHLVLVLVNLMLNAADAMPGGGALTVSAARAGAGHVELRVRDNGAGMTADVLSRAKAPLFTTKDAAHGTGLGLSVCDGIVRSAGGTLAIASAAGAGTEVVMRLPLERSSDG